MHTSELLPSPGPWSQQKAIQSQSPEDENGPPLLKFIGGGRSYLTPRLERCEISQHASDTARAGPQSRSASDAAKKKKLLLVEVLNRMPHALTACGTSISTLHEKNISKCVPGKNSWAAMAAMVPSSKTAPSASAMDSGLQELAEGFMAPRPNLAALKHQSRSSTLHIFHKSPKAATSNKAPSCWERRRDDGCKATY